ncbi:hypothetical protein [Flavobacterium muglaense]|uniref:Uncharacterized protein n=1 Tax=Flavobacterium muglaense TaxID=2764716 RepID=A0A923SG50_9FLAO|nr:hypothetical protein [Flavobacterium muglaense]MBC5838833.1 hypothetical protein [Flavobacterium muglaense]MBC5845336.1 hypothetical protein [Flavobacterium muglaense]
MNYNTQLCNTAWEKNYWHELRSVRVFDSKTVTVIFFGALAKEWQLKCKTFFLKRTKKNVLVIENVISEMKQTKMLG